MIVSYATGVDYHFYKEELYVTLSSGMILNYNLSVSETDSGTLSIEANPPQTTVYSTSGESTLGSITVDWLSDTIYWVEYDGPVTKVCRWTCTCILRAHTFISGASPFIYMFLYIHVYIVHT